MHRLDPHSGGIKIPPAVQRHTEHRILSHVAAHHAGKFARIEVRFRGALCYIDAYAQPQEPTPDLLQVTDETREEYLEHERITPHHLCRLRYFGKEDEWSLALYTHSHEKCEPRVFGNGSSYGTPEEAFDLAAALFAV